MDNEKLWLSDAIEDDDWFLPIADDAFEVLPLLLVGIDDAGIPLSPATGDCIVNQDEAHSSTQLPSTWMNSPPTPIIRTEHDEPRIGAGYVLTGEPATFAALATTTTRNVLASQQTRKRPTRKQQIEALRDQVTQLTLALSSMKSAAGLDLETPIARIPKYEPEPGEKVHLPLWKNLADKQRKRRKAAEQQNQALRDAVAAQSRSARRLRQMAEKLASDKHQLAQILQKNPQNIQLTRLYDDELHFESFAAEVDELYAGVDDTFQRAKMHEMVCPGRRLNARRCGANGWVLEVLDVHALPFGLKQTDRAMWACQTGSLNYEDSHEVRRSFQFSFDYPPGLPNMQQRRLVRRYCEEGRTVVIVRQITEPMSGVVNHVTARIVIKDGPLSITGPTSVIEMCVMDTGFASSAAQKAIEELLCRQNPDVLANEDLLPMSVWENFITRFHDSVESVLVAGSVNSPCVMP